MHTPLKSPLNGGIYLTTPLLKGVPLRSGEGAFQFFLIILRKILKKRIKDEILTLYNPRTVELLAMTDLEWA